MRAGRLRHRLIVERPDATRDDTGAELIEWASIGEYWAAIEPTRGKEAALSGQTLAELGALVILRWSPELDEISPKWRLRHSEIDRPVIYDILSVAHIKLARREIEIMVRSGINQG